MVVLYITHQHIHQNDFESSVSAAIWCQTSINISVSIAKIILEVLLYYDTFVSLPTFLMTELSSDCIVAFILFFFLLNKKNEMKIHVHIYSKKTRTTSKPKVTLQYHKILL